MGLSRLTDPPWTFAHAPPASIGYVASLLPDTRQPLESVSHAKAVARMRSDLSALRLHGDFFGIGSDHIRVAHAYHCHLERCYAEICDPASPQASYHAQTLDAFTHLQARGLSGLAPTLRLQPMPL